MAYRLPKRGKKEKGFDVAYGDEVFRLPLMENLPMGYLVEINAAQQKMGARSSRVQEEGQVAMMRVFMDVLEKYAPPVAAEITTSQFEDLMTAWSEVSTEEDSSLGES